MHVWKAISLRGFSKVLAAVVAGIICVGAAGSAERGRVVRVGLYENPPKIFSAPDGTPSGILIELLSEIARLALPLLVRSNQ